MASDIIHAEVSLVSLQTVGEGVGTSMGGACRDMITETVVKKIQIAKVLFDLAGDSFRMGDSPEHMGVGVILLQDSVELFILAVCEHLDVSVEDRASFEKYFVALENKTGDHVPLKKRMLTLNRQRVNIKHHGVLPNVEECKAFVGTVRDFFLEVSDCYLRAHFDSITLVEILKEDGTKLHLRHAEDCLKNGRYMECLVNCRKALYLRIERRYDVRVLVSLAEFRSLLPSAMCGAPDHAKSKEYIERMVCNPTEYIVLDHDKVNRDLLVKGVRPEDFWNVWRMTPGLYHYEESDEWVVKQDFTLEAPGEEDAEYCLRTTVLILLGLQRHWERMKSTIPNFATVEIGNRAVRVYAKASRNSTVILELQHGCREISAQCCVRGLDDDKAYYRVFTEVDSEGSPVYVSGYMCKDDVQKLHLG